LLSPEKPLCKQLATQLQVPPEWLREFFVFCLALHDLGKFSRSFQGLRQGLSSDLVKENLRMPYSYRERHDSLGFWTWIKVIQSALPNDFPCSEFTEKEAKVWLRYCEPWMEIVTGYHGIPPKKQIKLFNNFFQQEDNQAILEFVQDSFKLLLINFDFRPLLDKQLKKRLQAVSWQLAGIAVLADWTGSNQDYFDYCSQPQDLVLLI
jgi:CRISPR-associated endonuclease/helicase Cas3